MRKVPAFALETVPRFDFAMAEYQPAQQLHNDSLANGRAQHTSHSAAQARDESLEPEQIQGTAASTKRKRGEDGAQTRSKRNRYIAIACNECKRRKIKCNGEQPCQRCGNLQLECIYAQNCCSSTFKDSQEYKNMNNQIHALQEQVNTLWQGVNALRTALGHDSLPHQQDIISTSNNDAQPEAAAQPNTYVDPALNRNLSSPQQTKYQGPTSAQYNFDLARSSLQSMGITTTDDALESTLQSTQSELTSPHNSASFTLHPSVAPIREISKDEALRLCRVYEDEMGLMYPILDMNRISQYATLMFALGDAVERSQNISVTGGHHEPPPDADMEILKLVMANALVAESGGRSQLALRLFSSCTRRTDVSLSEDVTVKNIQLMTLVSMYLFHSDQETRSWRMIGVAARLCIELGLHRSETYTTLFSSDDERDAALRLFWSVYVLDKRWSLGTGMVSALTESDIDSKLDKPHASSPYLTCMVDYSKIGSQVWKSFGNKEATEGTFDRSGADYLNYQVLQWYKKIPNFLKYVGPRHADYDVFHGRDSGAAPQGRALYRLQVILYLRANLMRILIHRPVLHSAVQMLSSDHSPYAQKVVGIAKDSIRTLSSINQNSDIYRTQQMCFNYFLVSALAVLFLAVAHAPNQYATACRDEFYMALELTRGLSAQSAVSERLWKTVKGLKEIGPKLGLYQRQQDTVSNGHRSSQSFNDSVHNHHDAASSAAMAMAGLRAGRPVDENDFFAVTPSNPVPSASNRYGNGENRIDNVNPTSPNGMADDLMSLFEAAGAFAGPPANGSAYSTDNRAQVAAMSATPGGTGMGMAGGHEDDFGRIMRELF